MRVVANDASRPPAGNWDTIFSDDVESVVVPAEAGRRGTLNGIQIIMILVERVQIDSN